MLNPEAPPFIYQPSRSSYTIGRSSYTIGTLCSRVSNLSLGHYNDYPDHYYPPSSTGLGGGRSESASSNSTMDFDVTKLHLEIRTTVMIKNIPNKVNRNFLMRMLDEHCREENHKAAMEGSPFSAYDFVYLPMDFENYCNLGYAFVNFTSAIAGWRLYCAMHNRKWSIFWSKKTCHICYARIQGKQALAENFSRSCFVCPDDNFLPAVLSPPRDGVSSFAEPVNVGKLAWFRR